MAKISAEREEMSEISDLNLIFLMSRKQLLKWYNDVTFIRVRGEECRIEKRNIKQMDFKTKKS